MDSKIEGSLKTRFAAVSFLTVFVSFFVVVTPGIAQYCPGATDEGWDSGCLLYTSDAADDN